MEKIKKNTLNALQYMENHPNISLTKLAEMFGSERHIIRKYQKKQDYNKYTFLNKNNINDTYIYYFSPQELNFIQHYLNNPTLSFEEVCKDQEFIIPQNTLYRYLPILGYEKTGGKSQKYSYDRNKFSTIKTEEDAYWLGFITADGCIVKNKWLSISLAEKDIGHLKKFAKYMGLTPEETEEIILFSYGGAYTEDNVIVNIKICSKQIISNLMDKGITPQKSGKEKPYLQLDNNLQKHYIRGLIDGDGYLRSTEYGWGLVGSYEICDYVKQYIQQNIIDISDIHIHPHGIIYKLAGSGKNKSAIIISHFYKNNIISLDRKNTLYKQRYCRE